MRRNVIIPGMLALLIGLINLDTVCAAGLYLSSAHGDALYGVKRDAPGFPADYVTGHCAHCHEMHASIDGDEPDPDANSPSPYTLFYDNHIDQTDNFCYQCHTEAGSYQTGGGMINRSYSYRAGAWTADSVNDILEAFSFAAPDSSHSLDDIQTFITTNLAPMNTWEYTADSNPCTACHNPHAAQGDPENLPNGTKSAGTSRGWPVSLPSQHSKDNNAWSLWGDGVGEKMSDYAPPPAYQAPYRFNSGVVFEPDGSVTQDGSNLTDYVTFCTDCHNDTNTIFSTALGRNLNTFDWNAEKHGIGAADDNIPNIYEPATCNRILAPYQAGLCGTYALSCTDCHEPHGSPNLFLTRKEVNGAVVTVDTGTLADPSGRPNTEWNNLCNRCHNMVVGDNRHDHPATIPPTQPPPPPQGCSGALCHDLSVPPPIPMQLCTDCHNHGNGDIIDFLGNNQGPYGDQLF